MSSSSAIEWTDATWNPVTGCSRVSPGCAHCYALELAPKLRRFAQGRVARAIAEGREPPRAKWLDVVDGGRGSGPAFGVTLHEDELGLPLRWRRPRRVFVNSMSDLFHEDVPVEFIGRVLNIMGTASQHTFQVLTKRPERMREIVSGYYATLSLDPFPNVWLGVSIENRRFVGRADVLRETPAAVRFISAEPLLGPLFEPFEGWEDDYDRPGLHTAGIDWIIVGGESGPCARPLDPQWVRDIRDATRRWADDEVTQLPGRHCAFFFKQWGGRTPKAGGRELDGRTWDEFPCVPAAPAGSVA